LINGDEGTLNEAISKIGEFTINLKKELEKNEVSKLALDKT
jgi:hypothetical protein